MRDETRPGSAARGPVFAGTPGRTRAVRLGGAAVGAVLATWAVLVVASLLGAPWVPKVQLPGVGPVVPGAGPADEATTDPPARRDDTTADAADVTSVLDPGDGPTAGTGSTEPYPTAADGTDTAATAGPAPVATDDAGPGGGSATTAPPATTPSATAPPATPTTGPPPTSTPAASSPSSTVPPARPAAPPSTVPSSRPTAPPGQDVAAGHGASGRTG